MSLSDPGIPRGMAKILMVNTDMKINDYILASSMPHIRGGLVTHYSKSC